MAIQRWWEEFEHELFYHRRDDEAYMRHHFREKVCFLFPRWTNFGFGGL